MDEIPIIAVVMSTSDEVQKRKAAKRHRSFVVRGRSVISHRAAALRYVCCCVRMSVGGSIVIIHFCFCYLFFESSA